MSITRLTIETEVLQRLGDSGSSIWSASEIQSYIQQGYDRLAMDTGILFDTESSTDYASAFSHIAAFEVSYGETITNWSDLDTWPETGRQFTEMFERDYADNAGYPANHNHRWEYDDGYVETLYVNPLVDLPADLYEIERVTWDDRRIDALTSRELEQWDSRYELNTGRVDGYAFDKDGLNTLREWRVPSTVGRVLKVEYRRRGAALSGDSSTFEIPDRYVRYVRWFALAQSLGRDGDGQDLKLSAHYEQRFNAGIERINSRRAKVQRQKKIVMGSNGPRPSRPQLAKLPWNYGTVVR